MAARRTLGGGRVLGSGKDLAPPPVIKLARGKDLAPPSVARHVRGDSGLLSPSESSVSISSQTSSNPIAVEQHEDIASRVALDAHSSAQAAAAASSRMVCPICNEEMMTLLQLNRHIDDNHANLEEVEQDEAKSWFRSQMTKAKRFQPLAVLNQKLRGLEAFELNDERSGASTPATNQQRPAAAAVEPDHRPDPDDLITRTHWQRPSGYDACADPLCGKRLGQTVNGQINCRHCGKLFCEEHSMYQMKLSRSAQHEPVRGMWYRVCETCYKTKPGYRDTAHERDHSDYFKSVRRKTVDKINLEIGRLETRLTRLTQLLADPPPEQSQSATDFLWNSISGGKPQLRALEQTVVAWEDDASVAQCPFCQQAFSQYTFRRHHCRLCGQIVCGDPSTECSSEIALNAAITNTTSEKSGGTIPVAVRMCKDCSRTVFSKADFERELALAPADQRTFQHLVQYERGIRQLLPRFQRLLLTLQNPENPPLPMQLSEATKTRKRLTDVFTQYDQAARRIRDLPTTNSTQDRLQKAVYQQSMSFLHIHMLPLKSLPKIMKHATPNGMGKPQGALASIKYNDAARPGNSRASSTSSAAITALESEEKELRERVIVLEEQRFMVSNMIAEANKRRKFDEVAALSGNVADLDREIDQIQGQLAQMDFAGAYTGAIVE